MENEAALASPAKKISFGTAAVAFLILPCGTALLNFLIARGQEVSMIWLLALYLGQLCVTLVVALILKFVARSLWSRCRTFFFFMWGSFVPVAILVGLMINALAHWGGPPS